MQRVSLRQSRIANRSHPSAPLSVLANQPNSASKGTLIPCTMARPKGLLARNEAVIDADLGGNNAGRIADSVE